MSLLQNEEFVIYQLRTAYLAHIHDGVGERLINVNTGFLNDPAFRAAGWSANPAELKRCYSPPIPTAVTSEYFQAPPQSAGLNRPGAEDDYDEDGSVARGESHDTVGPTLNIRRRRRREQLEEDDSSDLSDESDEDAEFQQRPAGQIRFAKMPVRHRAGSSPVRRTSHSEGPSTAVSPTKLSEQSRQRTGSLGAVESSKLRARGDTVTSSEVSSDGNDLDATIFKRRQMKALGRVSGANVDRINEEDHEHDAEGGDFATNNAGTDSDDSLESGFSETLESNSLLVASSPLAELTEKRSPSPPDVSSKKNKSIAEALQILPLARPISTMRTISALSVALRARNKKPTSPLERFAILSGSGDASPLYIKLFVPSASNMAKPLEIVLRKTANEGEQVTVAEAIGFCLWKYGEEGLTPLITSVKRNVNRWTLRIVDDGDVDYDFPPLSRTRPITDFTYNNNRPARMRARDKPWDEVALVEADPAQFRENESLTPLYSEQAAASQEESSAPTDMPPPLQPNQAQLPASIAPLTRPNPITNPTFVRRPVRQDSTHADLPTPTSHAQQRSGAPKTIRVHFAANDSANPIHFRIDTTTDTYIAEIFDTACKRLNIDKALHMLKVTGTGVVAPSDRTVEALGAERSSLDLVRKRFVGDGSFGLSGSPGSTSPNAPLLLNTSNMLPTPRKLKKGVTTPVNPGASQHPLAQQYDAPNPLLFGAPSSTAKRYNVVRKQPMSFTPSHHRVLVLDGEYMNLMPGEPSTTAHVGGRERLFDPNPAGKITSVHFSSVVGCKVNRKHPKTFRVVVFREKESKRYDFEAGTKEEAAEIVAAVRKGIEPYRDLT